MQKNKKIEPLLLKSKIIDSIDRQQLLECYSCSEKYDHKVKIPMIACLSCIDIVCLKCLNEKCQSYKAKGMFNKCNKCPQQMNPAQFKKCLPLLNFIEIYQKIKSKEIYYRQTCQSLKQKLDQSQGQKKVKSAQSHLKIQIQRLNLIIGKILKQKQESTKQQQKLKLANTNCLERVHALANQVQRLQAIIINDQNIKTALVGQIQRLNTVLKNFHIARQNQNKSNQDRIKNLCLQINRLNQLLMLQNQKNKENQANQIKMAILNSKVDELQSRLRTQKIQFDAVLRQAQKKATHIKGQNSLQKYADRNSKQQLNYYQLKNRQLSPYRKAVIPLSPSPLKNNKYSLKKNQKQFEAKSLQIQNQQAYQPLIESKDNSFEFQKRGSISRERKTKPIFPKQLKSNSMQEVIKKKNN